MKTLKHTLVSICLLYSQAHGSEIINVHDHGILPGKNATFAITRLVESVRDTPGTVITFPKGEYHFHPENALETHRAVSNHDNSLKRLAFPLFDHNDITIDGGGSRFVFHGRIVPFTVDGSNTVTLKNLTIDWNLPFHDELEIVEHNENDRSFVVSFDPQRHPLEIRHGELVSKKDGWVDEMGNNIVFDPKTRAPIFKTRDYGVHFHKPHKASLLGNGRARIKAGGKSMPPVGSVLITYGSNPTSRLCPAIHLSNSSDIHLENITIRAAGGMGVIAERCDTISLDKMTVTSTPELLVSTRADATHFIGCKGLIRMENCLFEHMLDDATNVHGAYVKVVERLGKNDLLCEISHFQQWGLIFAGEGDEIALLSRTTVLPFHETTVTKVRKLNEHRFVLTAENLPEVLPDTPLSVENLTWYPDFVMRDNIVRENRARSVLVTTKGKVLIENNYFSSQMHGILIEGDNNNWYESGSVEDITIRNNTFVNIGFEASGCYPLLASPLFNDSQHTGEGQYHRNIRFVDNKLKSFNGRLVKAKSVKGLEISGNQMDFSSDYPDLTGVPSIDLSYCDDVVISGNAATGFETPLPITLAKDNAGVKIENNKGFSAPGTP